MRPGLLFLPIAALMWPHATGAVPILAAPDRFSVSLFAEFSEAATPGGAADDAFQITITDGSRGFAAGMLVTGGPGSDSRVFSLDATGAIGVVSSAFRGSETLVFAEGAYGTGALVSEPRESRIVRLLPDGSTSVFASVGTPPFGVAALSFGTDGALYASDFTGQALLRVDPDGSSTAFSALPSRPPSPTAVVQRAHKAMAADTGGLFGGAFVAGTFSLDVAPTGIDSLYAIGPDGTVLDEIASGLNGLELVTFGPGGIFGHDLFVATAGTLGATDGAVFTLAPDGVLSPFATGFSAAHVAFDTTGVFGGDMFVTELSLTGADSRIWRISVIPLPGSGWAMLGALGLVAMLRRRRFST